MLYFVVIVNSNSVCLQQWKSCSSGAGCGRFLHQSASPFPEQALKRRNLWLYQPISVYLPQCWEKLAVGWQSGPEPRWMQYHAFWSSSCSGQGYKKKTVSALRCTIESCVLCFTKVTLSGQDSSARKGLCSRSLKKQCVSN